MNTKEQIAKQSVYLCLMYKITPQRKIECIIDMLDGLEKEIIEEQDIKKVYKEQQKILKEKVIQRIKHRKQKKGHQTGIRMRAIHKLCKEIIHRHPKWSYSKCYRHAVIRYDTK